MLLRFTSEEENNGESIEKAGKVNVLSALLWTYLIIKFGRARAY